MIRRAVTRLRSDEAGLSLAELLVSALLTTLILAMAGSFFISTAKITANSTQTTDSTNDAANIANEITSVLRVATTLAKSGAPLPDAAIVSGSREALTVYSLSNTDANNPAPVRISFSIGASDDRTVTETRCKATSSGGFWVFGSCTTTTRKLGGNIMPLTGTPEQKRKDQMFTYYTAGGAEIVIDDGTLSDSQRATVATVRVNVSVKATGAKTKQVVISNRVVLGNLGLDTTS